MNLPITRRRSVLAVAASLSIGGLLVAAGCNSASTQTPASLAPEPDPVGNFTGTTQPVRNFPPSVAFYQNGDTASGSTGVRFVNGIGYNSGQTGPAGGYGYVGANNAAGGAGAASGDTGTALAGTSSGTGFTAPNAGAVGGTGLTGTNAGPTADTGLTGPNGVATATPGTPANGAASANQTAAGNAAGVAAGTVGQGGSGIIADRGITTPSGNTVNTGNDAASISGRNVASGAGAAVGSGTGTGTIGGTDVTGRTGVSPEGVITSNANTNTNTVGGVAVARGTGDNAGPGSGGTTQAQPSLAQRAETAGLVASTPVVGTGTFLANVVTSPYTLYEQRGGIISSGVQFPPTYTAMPAVPPTPANSPVNPQDLPVTIRGQRPGIPPATAPLSADLSGVSPATRPIKPAVLTPVEDASNPTAFTIAGDVQFPGHYQTGTTVTISQAILGAGLNSAADPSKVTFNLARNGNEPARATLAELQGGQVQDIVLKPGDVLTVSMQPQEIVTNERPTTVPATGPLRARGVR